MKLATRRKVAFTGLLALCAAGFAFEALAQTRPPKYSAKIPSSITTPDTVKTRIGTLKFKGGAPDQRTVQLAYDQLDFARGVQAYMTGTPAAGVFAICRGLNDVGITPNRVVGITETFFDAHQLVLTANTTTVYVATCLDLSNGPVVLQAPPGVLGPADDANQRWVVDIGLTGPDKGAGGKYLFVPPGYAGALPSEGYFIARPRSNTVMLFFRAFVKDGDIPAAVAGVKTKAAVYPLAAAANPPPTTFVNMSGKQFNMVHGNDFSFYEELNAVVQSEPADWVDPETVGLYAAIGIKKGQPFAPDARMKAILTDAVAVANAGARAILFANRDSRAKLYADRHWYLIFVGGSADFVDGAERMLDARTLYYYYASGVSPAMAASAPGTGSAYAGAYRDSEGRYFDGGKTYNITLPAPIPAKQFWSFQVYDNQTRSLLETDQKGAGLDSNSKEVKANADGSYTVWFGPKAPAGHEGNWVQTWPGKGWNTLFRLYGPLQPWFDRTWKPGDFELVQ